MPRFTALLGSADDDASPIAAEVGVASGEVFGFFLGESGKSGEVSEGNGLGFATGVLFDEAFRLEFGPGDE